MCKKTENRYHNRFSAFRSLAQEQSVSKNKKVILRKFSDTGILCSQEQFTLELAVAKLAARIILNKCENAEKSSETIELKTNRSSIGIPKFQQLDSTVYVKHKFQH